MAYSTLPHPGTAFGPCLEECTHRDCAETRRMAESICPVCGGSIGYYRSFSHGRQGIAHFACLLEQEEARLADQHRAVR